MDEPRNRLKILIVDDEREFRQATTDVCRVFGHLVEDFDNVDSALEAFSGRPDDFDAALLDLCVGHDFGADLAVKLRLVRPGIPVMFMTGSDKKVIESATRLVRDAKVLRKPFPLMELRVCLEDIVLSASV